MAAKGGGSGESKQGLIITLVIFVLISIILSVVAYYGYADQAKLEQAAKDASQKEATAKKDRDSKQFQMLLVKAYAGITEKDDLKDLAGQISQYQGQAEFQNVANVMKQKGLDWDQNQNRPSRTMAEEIARLSSTLADTIKGRDKAVTDAKKARDDYDNVAAGAAAELKRARDDLAKANAQVVSEKEDSSKKLLEAVDRIAKQDKEIEDLTKKTVQTADDKDKEIRKLKADYADLANLLKKTQEKLPQLNILDYDVAKGKIVRLDRVGSTAYINLGTADNVKPGLTFSVFGSSAAGKASRVRKGAVEVANVLGDHLASARVTEVRDSSLDPIITGDLLFNPAWTSNTREHVAIAGIIDLTGEGRDGTAEFIRNLERQGIVVDAYIDSKDMSVKGKLNWNTTYLILGDTVDLDTGSPLKETDPRLARKKEFLAKVGEMQAEAERYGTTKVPVRRFLQLIGYPLPRGSGAAPSSDFYFKPGAARAPAEESVPNGKPAPKGDDK